MADKTIQQNFPPELANKVGLAGGNMVSAMKALGCLGLISNGPSRDIDEVRPMGFQYMLSGITPGHGIYKKLLFRRRGNHPLEPI